MVTTIARPNAAVAGSLVRQYVTTLGVNGVTIILQLFSLLLATQALQVEEVGQFLAISATSAIAFSLVGLGFAEVLTAEIARTSKKGGRYLNLALLQSGVSFAVILLPLSWLETLLVQALSFGLALVFNINLLLFARLISIAENTEIGFGRADRAALMRLVYAGLQVCAFLALFALPPEQRFAALAFTTAAAGALACAVASFWLLGPHLTTLSLPRTIPWHDALQYLAGQLLSATTTNLDRVIATAMLGETAAAIYVLASRAAQIAAMPVTIFFRTTYHRFFAVAEAGDTAAERRFFDAMLLRSSALAIATAIAASLGFWLATTIVIPDYAGATPAFTIICAAMPFTALYYCSANRMNARRQLLRRNIVDATAVVLIMASFVAFSGTGSAIALALALLLAKVLTAALAFVLGYSTSRARHVA